MPRYFDNDTGGWQGDDGGYGPPGPPYVAPPKPDIPFKLNLGGGMGMGSGLQMAPFMPSNRFAMPGAPQAAPGGYGAAMVGQPAQPGMSGMAGPSPQMQMGLLGAQMLANRFQPQQVQRGAMGPQNYMGSLMGLLPLLMQQQQMPQGK